MSDTSSPRPKAPRRSGAAPGGSTGKTGGGKGTGGKSGGRRSGARVVRGAFREAGTGARPWWRRPISITLILAGLFVGLPVAQALFGEIGAVMLGCLVAGFALGRATA